MPAPYTLLTPHLDKELRRALDDAFELGRVRGYAEAKGGQTFRASAYRTDKEFGYDRWTADEYSGGRGTHVALITILEPRECVNAVGDKS
jgi:hypothetical protein